MNCRQRDVERPETGADPEGVVGGGGGHTLWAGGGGTGDLRLRKSVHPH